MGLDGVELILATEEEFGIEIADSDAANLLTPHQLAAHVSHLLGRVEMKSSRCLSRAAFYRIRRTLCAEFSATRDAIHLATPLAPYLASTPRQRWRQLIQAIDARQLPRLVCPGWLTRSLGISLPLIALALAVMLALPPWGLLLMPALTWLLSMLLLDRLAWLLPAQLQTISDLVPYVRIAEPTDWNADYVLQRVMQLTAIQLGLKIGQLHPDSRFVEDLGLD